MLNQQFSQKLGYQAKLAKFKMAKKRSIEEVETSNNSDGVQPRKKKTKKVRSNQCLVILCFCMNKSNFWSFIYRENGQTNNACWCSVHVVYHTGEIEEAKIVRFYDRR